MKGELLFVKEAWRGKGLGASEAKIVSLREKRICLFGNSWPG